MPVATKDLEKVKICIDRGGTFCDVIAMSDSKGDHLIKLLSVDPAHYSDAPREGVRRVLEWFTGETISRDEPIDATRIEYIRMGTTVATNALLERKGENCALLITKGFGDSLEIGTQTRPHLFELAIKKPDVLYTKVVEVSERVTPEWSEFLQDPTLAPKHFGELVDGVNGSKLRIIQPLDVAQVTTDLQESYDEGYRSIAIVLCHSYLYPEHEKRIEAIARQIGFPQISVSSDLQAMINLVSRGTSATADAYLTPEVRRYLESFAEGFKGGFQDENGCRVSFMQSDGSLCDFRRFSGLRAILSGPAGGVVGYARTGFDRLDGCPVVGFDMGGTSTDVSRYGGNYEHVFETTTAGVTIQTPQLDINTVAAGGGSILTYRNGLFFVGPESAGAHPGPACYRKGGPLTVTDANLFLGRLHIDSFPKIFGPGENLPLDREIVREKFEALTVSINAEAGSSFTAAEVACGFVNVANTSMARPIRALTEQRGFRTSAHNLSCFGGAGGQHACALAAVLGMHTVIVHKYSSLLSAYGMALADVAVDVSEPFPIEYSPKALEAINDRFESLKESGRSQLLAQGVPEETMVFECYLNLRYRGSDTKLMILTPKDSDYVAAFIEQHKREFAFVLDTFIDVEDVRVRAIGRGEHHDMVSQSTYVSALKSLPTTSVDPTAHFGTENIYFEEVGGYTPALLYRLDDLHPGTVVKGPAIILDKTQTILLHPHNSARILYDHVYIDVGLGPRKVLDTSTVDPIQLSIFSHRFMGIAEQMGRALQKTAISLQIKERLDFSCAIFGPDASLVANAPNVPVHLGSMQYAVQFQAELHKGQLRPGDILVSNHPKAGGTHLPDITVIQPVFTEDTTDIVFWVAARGHHTDIGGLGGNSMHPATTENWQEGAAITSTFLVRDGVLNEQEIRDIFAKAGEYPGCLVSRQIDVNFSDMKAQCSACAVGSAQIHSLFGEYGKEVVQHYMAAIRLNAELAVRSFLKTWVGVPLVAEDYMDNGAIIRVKISIDGDDGSATFDFSGTSPESLSNLNAPESITRSAIIYSLRVLVGTDLPLNAGVLAPIQLVIPPNSILSPSNEAAVCAGNTETSQRLVDVIFKAFEACAASQGTMNATHFNYKQWSYGETICGGAGAGPTWSGQSAVQIHMTNTRIGDVEIAEKRFPFLIREFSIRRGSGGKGKNNGGDGVHREYQARVDVEATHTGERRVIQPYGMHGGGVGERGASYVVRQMLSGGVRKIKMQPSSACYLKAGDSLIIHTPGGGAYGSEGEVVPVKQRTGLSGAIIGEVKHFGRANGSVAAYAQAQESCD
ncbi:putative cytoplasm protein [Naematelia encephala]|uniref:Putative cytoplasm protein n=1 Tax=Naematelia encephala TaxID=71784 RepID=A0A1Y2AXU5_9TREE|nr:putative cytoplasm protein [Naematelia encephala]